jgi:serine/threonine-protein kinase ATR
MAKVLLAIHERDHDRMPAILYEARRELGFAVTASSRQYARAYPAILRLHMLHEVALIRQAGLDIASIDQALGMQGPNKDAAVIHKIDIVRQTLANRLETTLPSFRIRESVLSIRRTAYAESPSNNATLKAEVGAAWIASAKIARKAGHEQTAYSATLQAKLAAAPDVFFQQTKILKATGHPLKALNELENGIRGLYVQAQAEHLRGTRTVPITLDGGQNTSIQAVYDLQLAKVSNSIT